MTHPVPAYTIDELRAEPPVHLAAFTRDDAAHLGELAVEVIREWGLSLAVDIHIGDELAYRAQLGRTGQENADAIAGKILVARRFGQPSLLARLRLEQEDPTLADGLDERHKFWGGSIPIHVGDELSATITASGEPDAVDHEVAREALRRFMG